MTSKQQERAALAKIQKIIAGLGENSYIAAAFEGCFEIAEQNIENDWACSMKQRAESAEQKLEVATIENDTWRITARDLQNALEKTKASAQEQIDTLQTALNAAEEAYQHMTAEYMTAQNKIESLASTERARAVKRNNPSVICEYDNVLEITAYTAKDMGYCKRLWLDDGRAVDFWASDWAVEKLGWVEV